MQCNIIQQRAAGVNQMCKFKFLANYFIIWTLYFYCLPHDWYFFSSTILPHKIVNNCPVFCHLVSLQTYESITQTGRPGLYFIVSQVPETTNSPQHSPFNFSNAFSENPFSQTASCSGWMGFLWNTYSFAQGTTVLAWPARFLCCHSFDVDRASWKMDDIT